MEKIFPKLEELGCLSQDDAFQLIPLIIEEKGGIMAFCTHFSIGLSDGLEIYKKASSKQKQVPSPAASSIASISTSPVRSVAASSMVGVSDTEDNPVLKEKKYLAKVTSF